MTKHDNAPSTDMSSIDATELAAIGGGTVIPPDRDGWTCYTFFGIEICIWDGVFSP
jgi:hypothetical protein